MQIPDFAWNSGSTRASSNGLQIEIEEYSRKVHFPSLTASAIATVSTINSILGGSHTMLLSKVGMLPTLNPKCTISQILCDWTSFIKVTSCIKSRSNVACASGQDIRLSIGHSIGVHWNLANICQEYLCTLIAKGVLTNFPEAQMAVNEDRNPTSPVEFPSFT